MAKRFIDTDIFKKRFVKGLNGAYKLLWIYILNDCNHAGIWEVDFDIASRRCKFKYDQKTAEKYFGNKVVFFDGGEKCFIPSFIEFQYGELNEKNRVHASILSILRKYNLTEIKPLTSPLQGAMDMDKDKDKDKEEGGMGETSLNGETILGEMQRMFSELKNGYKFSSDDLSHIRQICEWLGDVKDVSHADRSKVISEWGKMLKNIKEDDHYQKYGLQQVYKFRAEIYNYKPKAKPMAEIINNDKFKILKAKQDGRI